MGGLFSKSGEKKATSKPSMNMKDRAILDLKVARDRLEKARKKHEKEKDVYVEKAKEMLKLKKKDQAKLALRLKKMREIQIDKVSAQLLNIEQLVQDVEWAQHQVEIVEGMKAGNLALKELQLDVEEVEQIMADTQEAMDRQREIDEVISGTLNPEDEDSVLAELDAIETEEAKAVDASLPAVPTTQPVSTPDVPVELDSEPVAEERQAVLA